MATKRHVGTKEPTKNEIKAAPSSSSSDDSDEVENSTSNVTKAAATKTRAHWPARRESYLDNFKDAAFNFIILVLAVWLANVVVDSWLATGKFVDYDLLWYILADFHWACIVIVVFFAVTLFGFYSLVKLVALDWINGFNALAYVLYSLLQLCMVVGPILLLAILDPQWRPVASAAVTMVCAVFTMKAHSYFFTNRHIYEFLHALNAFDRDIGPPEKLGLKGIVGHNLPLEERKKKFNDVTKISHYFNFLLYPTLCYYLEYPLNPKISKRKVLLHFVQTICAFEIAYIALVDACIPQWKTIVDSPIVALLRTLLPGFIIWMTMFFGIFHALLNLLAELTRFADRRFYGVWWECRDMQSWWREWNCCVSDWMRRHIYFQSMQDAKFSSWWAGIMVFILSALWHEWILMMALRRFRPFLSSLMIAQILLISMTNHRIFRDTKLGNFVIWFAFIVGYPLVQNLYAFAWYFDNIHLLKLNL